MDLYRDLKFTEINEWGTVCFWESAGGLGGNVCFLLTHKILSTIHYMLTGLKKLRDTERSEHTAICPAVPSLWPPHLLRHLYKIQFWTFLFCKNDLFLYYQNLVFLGGGLDLFIKSEKRHQRAALLSIILTDYTNCYSELEINYLSNGVRA